MSVLNLNARLSKVKETREAVIDMKGDFDKLYARFQKQDEALQEFGAKLASFADDLKLVHEMIGGQEEAIQKVENESATKEEVKAIADEVTACMEEYVLNATPRNMGNQMDDKIKEIDEQLNYIMGELAKQQEHVVEKDPSIPKIVFRKPERKPKA